MGVLPDCLGTLQGDAQRWTECTEAFDRQDSRCKLRAARMSETMQRCSEKGYSRPDINAAMARGASSARGYAPHESDTLPERPAPRPDRGPIPGFRKPAEG
jgi:hypothetical protein